MLMEGLLSENRRAELRAAQRRGAELLDEKRPSWRTELTEALRQHPLNLATCQQCVLGLLFGNYINGCKALRVRLGAEYGFALSFGPLHRVGYAYLEHLWLAELTPPPPTSVPFSIGTLRLVTTEAHA